MFNDKPKPLEVSINPQKSPETKPREMRKVYFFERENGTYYFTDARDAWQILKGRKQVVGQEKRRDRLVGTSDGHVYDQAVSEAHKIFKEQGLAAAQERLRQGIKEEYEEAKKHVELPPDSDTTDRSGNPINMSTLR